MTTDHTAFVFPGQGAQTVGMGRAAAERYPEAAAVFEAADRALGEDLSRLCWEGPEEELQLTANTQPAILTTSVALLRVLEARGFEPAVVAGHSLGEYSALVAARCLDLEDAVRLVRRRGELMQEAVPIGVGAMAAIIGLGDAEIRRIVDETHTEDSVCAISNLNAPGQTVIAGHRGAIDRAVEAAQTAGAKRALMLAVSAPFHSPLMRPAREAMATYLEETDFHDPAIPVVTNVDAAPATTGAEVRDALLRQIDQPVRWVETVGAMVERFGVTTFLEIGPGKALCSMIRRIAKGTTTKAVSGPDGLEQLMAA